MIRIQTLLSAMVAIGFGTASAAGSFLTQGPTCSIVGDKVRITFTVSASIDVEVAILDRDGKVCRHLAAGVLGGTNPPPAPLQAGLSQVLEWDAKDDLGRWIERPPFRVRVRTGVKPLFSHYVSLKSMTTTGFDFGPENVNPTADYIDTAYLNYFESASHVNEPFHGVPSKLDICVSDLTDELLMKPFQEQVSVFGKFDGVSGAFKARMNPFNKNMGYGHTGEWVLDWSNDYVYYTHSQTEGKVHRFSYPQCLPAPYAATDTNIVDSLGQGGDIHCRGMAPGPDGSMYVMHYATELPSVSYMRPQAVSQIKDGRVVRRNIVLIDGSVSGGIKVDARGNIYIGTNIRRRGEYVPSTVNMADLSGTITTSQTQQWWAKEMYGSILKFPNSGGRVRVTEVATDSLIGGGAGSGTSGAVAENMEWMYFGLSHVMNHASTRGLCWCHSTRFDLDGYGRIFFPNTFQFQYVAIDNNRNEIFRLRNRDLGAAQIGMGHQIEVTDRALYVSDWLNNRVAAFDWDAADDSTVEIAGYSSVTSRAGKSRLAAIANTPNPFNPSTTIRYAVTGVTRAPVHAAIYGSDLRLVRTLVKSDQVPGEYNVRWDGRDDAGRLMASGNYICRVQYGSLSAEKVMLLMK